MVLGGLLIAAIVVVAWPAEENEKPQNPTPYPQASAVTFPSHDEAPFSDISPEENNNSTEITREEPRINDDWISIDFIHEETGRPVPFAEIYLYRLESRESKSISGRIGSEVAKELAMWGQLFRTDENGKLKLSRIQDPVAITAVGENCYAHFPRLNLNEPRGALGLRPNRVIPVSVQDYQGSGVEHAFVSLHFQMATGFSFPLFIGQTGANGTIFIPILDRYSRNQELKIVLHSFSNQENIVTVAKLQQEDRPVTFLFPDPSELKIQFQAPQLPDAPAYFVLRDIAYLDHPSLSNTLTPGFLFPPEHTIAVSAKSRSLILNGYILSRGLHAEVSLVTPSAKGTTVEVPMEFSMEYPAVSGRILNEDGVIGRNLNLQYAYRYPGLPSTRQPTEGIPLSTNDEGIFEILVPNWNQQGLLRKFLVVIPRTRSKPERFAEVDLSQPLPKEVKDLGDLILRPSPVLASGRVVDRDGIPIQDALIRIPSEDSRSYKSGVSGAGLYAETNQDGAFLLRGVFLEDLKSIRCDHRYFRTVDISVLDGSHNLNITLERTVEVRGRVLVDRFINESDLMINLYFRESKNPDHESSTRTIPDRRGKFQIIGAYGDESILEIVNITDYENTFVLYSTLVPNLDQGEDIDLGTIDLRGKLRQYHVSVLNQEGDMPRDAWIHHPESPPGNAQSISLWKMEYSLYGPSEGLPILVGADGYRTQSLVLREQKSTVELLKGPDISIHAKGLPELPSRYRYQLKMISLPGGAKRNGELQQLYSTSQHFEGSTGLIGDCTLEISLESNRPGISNGAIFVPLLRLPIKDADSRLHIPNQMSGISIELDLSEATAIVLDAIE